MGSRALCDSCNNNTGSWYVPELIRWAQMGVGGLRELPPSEREDRDPKPKMAVVRFPRVHPLRFIKQAVTMLLTANGPGRLRDELAPFVLDKTRTGLPSRYSVYLAMVRGSRMRRIGLSSRLSLESGKAAFLTEIAYPPFAYLLTIDTPEPILRLGNITKFADYSYDDLCDVELPMGRGIRPHAVPCRLQIEGGHRG